MRMLCIGGKEGVWTGAVGAVYGGRGVEGWGREKGSCQTGDADPMQRGEHQKSPSTFPVSGKRKKKEKRVLQQQPQ